MSKKRGHNEGSISKRKDGLWTSVATVGRKPDGSLRRRTFYGKTRKEVNDKLQKALADLQNGKYVDKNKILVKDWLEKWLWTYKSSVLKPKTFSSYKMLVDVYINNSLAYIPIQDLCTNDIQEMIVKLTSEGLSSRTVKYTCTVLSGALEQAIKNNLINTNVCRNAVLPQQVKRREARVMSQEDQEKFINSIKGHRLFCAFLLLLSTGCRIGELLALKYENVNWDEGFIKISQTLQRIETTFDKKWLYNKCWGKEIELYKKI